MESPILQAEIKHLHDAQHPAQRAGLRWGVRLILIAGMLISLLVFAIEFVASWNWEYGAALAQSERLVVIVGYVLPSVLLLPLTLILDLVIVYRTLLLASDTVAREQRGRTWQLLILTAQSPRKIVLDKWWATVIYFAPQYLMLAWLRVGVVVLMGLEYYRIQYFYFGNNSQRFISQTQPLPFAVSASTLLLGVGLITLFTVANLLFTAALGVFVSIISRSTRAGLQAGVAFAVRLVLLVAVAVPMLWLSNNVQYLPSVRTPTLPFPDMGGAPLAAFGFSLLDNGTFVTAAFLTQPAYTLNLTFLRVYTPVMPPTSIPLAYGFYALVTLVCLGGAIGWLRRRAT